MLRRRSFYCPYRYRPVDIALPDDMESPDSMEAIIKSIGGKTVDWNFKTECCGAAHSIAHTDIDLLISPSLMIWNPPILWKLLLNLLVEKQLIGISRPNAAAPLILLPIQI